MKRISSNRASRARTAGGRSVLRIGALALAAAVFVSMLTYNSAAIAQGMIKNFPAPTSATQPQQQPGPGDVTVNPYSGAPDAVKTITKALATVRPGGRVFIYPGVYNENLEIKKSVELIGLQIDITSGYNVSPRDHDPDIVVQPADGSKSCLKSASSDAVVRIERVRFDGGGLNANVACVLIEAGQFTLSDGMIGASGGVRSPMLLVKGGNVEVRSSRIYGGTQGVQLSATGTVPIVARLFGNWIEDNGDGVVLEGANAANPLVLSAFLSDNYILNNLKFGVISLGADQIELTRNKIWLNGSSGAGSYAAAGPDDPVRVRRVDQTVAEKSARSVRQAQSVFAADRRGSPFAGAPAAAAEFLTRLNNGGFNMMACQTFRPSSGVGEWLVCRDKAQSRASRNTPTFMLSLPVAACANPADASCSGGVHLGGMTPNWSGAHRISGNEIWGNVGHDISVSSVTTSALSDRLLRGVERNTLKCVAQSVVDASAPLTSFIANNSLSACVCETGGWKRQKCSRLFPSRPIQLPLETGLP